MKKIFNSAIKNQRGQGILIIVLVLLVLGVLILTPLLAFMGTGLKVGQMHEERTLRLYAADSGVETAIHWLTRGKETDGAWSWDEDTGSGERAAYTINDRSVDVTVEEMEGVGPNVYKITSVATSVGGGTTVLSTVWAITWFEGDWELGTNDTYYGDVHVTGDATVGNNATIVGDLTVEGDLTLESNSEVDGDVSVQGDITLEQHSKITGIVCSEGNVTLANNVDIIGDMRVGGNLTLNNAARIEGDIFIGGDITFAQNADIIGTVYATGDITITFGQPNATIDGAVYATGSVTIVPIERVGNVTGGIFQNQSEDDYPPPPDCPGIPANPVDILTWEAT